MNQEAFLMRGLPTVPTEFSWSALAYNLRALNIVEISGFMAGANFLKYVPA
jgi:hypothetical protein